MFNLKEIKAIRGSLRLTQERFAAKLGVSVKTVSRWENNRASPHPYLAKQIKRIYMKA